jgi:hypothetical protein
MYQTGRTEDEKAIKPPSQIALSAVTMMAIPVQRALSIAQAQYCAGVLTQSIREIAPCSLPPVKSFLLVLGERPIGVKNIRRLARKPYRKALRAKAPPPRILKRTQLGSQRCCCIFAILHATSRRHFQACERSRLIKVAGPLSLDNSRSRRNTPSGSHT